MTVKLCQKKRRKVRKNGCMREINQEMNNCENGRLEIEDICTGAAEMVAFVLALKLAVLRDDLKGSFLG